MQSIDQLKRKLLLWMLAMAWIGTVPGWIIKEWLGQSSLVLRAIFALNTVFHPVVFYISWKRLVSQRTVELACLSFAAIVCAGCMGVSLYSSVYGASMDLEPLYLWIPVIYVFAFTLFDHKRGLKFSLGTMALFFAVSLPYLVRPAHTHTVFTITLHVVSAAFVAALYFFSGYQHRLQLAQMTMDELALLANTDQLTGLANRRRVIEVAETELRRSVRYGNTFAIILIDIDFFKSVNDRLGHDVGDQALKALGRRISDLLREVDLIGRWGGEEFIVVLPETNYLEALGKAEAVCRHVFAAPLFDDLSISISCGVTSASPGDSIPSMLQRSDAALYSAKNSGRNQAVGFPADLQSALPPVS